MANSPSGINTPRRIRARYAVVQIISCNRVARECPAYSGHVIISRRNAACNKLTHAFIRKVGKGGRLLHNAVYIVLVAADVSTRPRTTVETLE